MNHWQIQDAIDDLLDSYTREAKALADKIWTDSAYHSERDREVLLSGCLTGRIRILLDEIALDAPALLDALVKRQQAHDHEAGEQFAQSLPEEVVS